ncbi:hypothetical protein LIER_23046 [Lithospermum erythrorhizon]|uniref:Uncharacterized protein n=1 Tax=Lithospermum erythrorhizon TaxID=34254 RepID=A0AAV3R1P3_LITER
MCISKEIDLLIMFGNGGTKARGGAGAGKAVEETKEKTDFDLKLERGYEAAAKIKTIKERASSFYYFSSEKNRPCQSYWSLKSPELSKLEELVAHFRYVRPTSWVSC